MATMEPAGRATEPSNDVDQSVSSPHVIHTYRTKYASVAQAPGLGDFLRGSLALAVLAEKKGFDLSIDFSNHPIGGFVISAPPSMAEVHVEEFFNERKALLEPFVESLRPGQIVTISTHQHIDEKRITDAVRSSLRAAIRFNADIEATAASIATALGGPPFAVLHIRVADEDARSETMGSGSGEIAGIVAYVEAFIYPQWGSRIAVLSNNQSVKRMLAERFGLYYIQTGSVHLGECGTSDSDVRDSLIDFSLIARSSHIFSYSAYGWTSGFSRQCANVYDIPYTQILLGDDSKGVLAKMKILLRHAKRTFRYRHGV
jgi:hypothetical protein